MLSVLGPKHVELGFQKQFSRIKHGSQFRMQASSGGAVVSTPKGKSGTPLAKDPRKHDYRDDLADPIWQFRVCHDSKDCSLGGTVKADDKFVLNDVIGRAGDGAWFMCHGAHYRACDRDHLVKELTARRWCNSDGCGICLSTDPKGIGRVCPNGRSLGDDTNPRACMPYLLEEVACLAKNPLAGAKQGTESSLDESDFMEDDDSMNHEL